MNTPIPVTSVFATVPSVRAAVAPLLDIPQEEGLAPDERTAVRAFRSKTRRREWIAARVLLKSLLPDIPPTELAVRADDRGRPFLVRGGVPVGRDVSLSHGGGFVAAALATAPGLRLGIDVECASPRLAAVERMFRAPGDRVLQEDHHTRLVLWTLKEAGSKAQGSGLAGDFRTWTCVERAPGTFDLHGPHGFIGIGFVERLDADRAAALVLETPQTAHP